MKAEEARKIAEKVNTETDVFLMEAIYRTIEKAAMRGESRVAIAVSTFGGKLNPYMAKLKEMGYVVRLVSDQRDGDYVRIGW